MDNIVLKVCSVFLQYPDAEWVDPGAIGDILAAIAEGGQAENLKRFGTYLLENSLFSLQEKYVQTFDFQEKVTLHLSSYIDGSHSDRSRAMMLFQQSYHEAGYTISANEQPDFLPAILEFGSIVPFEKTQLIWKTLKPALNRLHVELINTDSVYRYVISAVLGTIDKE